LGPGVFPAYSKTSVAVRSLIGALDDDQRAELARELVAVIKRAEQDADDDNEPEEEETNSTSTVAVEPASDDAPDEPRVASHDYRNQIAEALRKFRQTNQRE